MNFLRNKKLRQLGAYLGLSAVLIFVAQYFILDQRLGTLEEAELKQEYTRAVQLANQHISLNVQDYLNGNRDLSSAIAAQITEQEHRLKILAAGGRVEQRADFVQPLSRLPRMTFEGLQEDWQAYKKAVYFLLENHNAIPESITESIPQSIPLVADSVADSTTVASPTPAVMVKTGTTSSLITYQGLALSMGKWYDRLMLDLEEEVQTQRNSLASLRTSITVFNIILIAGLFLLFSTYVVAPLERLKSNVSEGNHSKDFPDNEIGQLAQETNHTIEQLRDATDFVTAIGKGDLSIDYRESFDRTYIEGRNLLADSLIKMQGKLRELNEEEGKRQWANEGLARFVDILRSSNDNIHALGDKVISGLVQYMRANQGALYILNEETTSEKALDLISLFAYDVKKHDQQRIKPGEGILGQTFLEKQTTYLTALPEEYIRITSGLGGAAPKSVLIVPLKVDQDVYGLVELASFNVFHPHEIAFVEKLGESIASTLASVRAAQKNRDLIEQFQQQAEEMKAQEEEMRQNMEELQATQEEVVRKERDYIAKIEALEKALREMPAESNEAAVQAFARKEEAYEQKLQELSEALKLAQAKEKDWEIAEELAKTLRVNLDALSITKEELRRKSE